MSKERLVELLDEAFIKSDDNYGMPNTNQVADRLLANGVIVPPCKVGDSCYPLSHSRNKPIVERKISRITYSARNIIIGYYENDGQYRPPLRTRILGEDVFLTREGAVAKLKEGENNA